MIDQAPAGTPEKMKQGEFARLIGVRPSYITQLKKQGRLVMDGRLVDVAASLVLIEQTADPAKAAVAERHAKARTEREQSPTVAHPEPVAEQGDEDNDTDDIHSSEYAHWKARKERAHALKAEREHAEAIGALLDANQVASIVASAATQLRTGLEGLPTDLAAELAATQDEQRVIALLTQRINHLLDETSRQFKPLKEGNHEQT